MHFMITLDAKRVAPVFSNDAVALVARRNVEHASSWHIDTFKSCVGKTQVVIFTKKRILNLRPVSISELILESKLTAKYLELARSFAFGVCLLRCFRTSCHGDRESDPYYSPCGWTQDNPKALGRWLLVKNGNIH